MPLIRLWQAFALELSRVRQWWIACVLAIEPSAAWAKGFWLLIQTFAFLLGQLIWSIHSFLLLLLGEFSRYVCFIVAFSVVITVHGIGCWGGFSLHRLFRCRHTLMPNAVVYFTWSDICFFWPYKIISLLPSGRSESLDLETFLLATLWLLLATCWRCYFLSVVVHLADWCYNIWTWYFRLIYLLLTVFSSRQSIPLN